MHHHNIITHLPNNDGSLSDALAGTSPIQHASRESLSVGSSLVPDERNSTTNNERRLARLAPDHGLVFGPGGCLGLYRYSLSCPGRDEVRSVPLN
jgi:hypothetical protein